MLHVTLDASLLNSITHGVENDFDLSLTYSGVFWENIIPTGSDELPQNIILEELKNEPLTSDKSKNIRNILYPWNWEFPDSIRIYWLKAAKEGVKQYEFIKDKSLNTLFIDIKLLPFVVDEEYKEDKDNLIDYYTGLFDRKIWKNGVFDPYQLIWDPSITDVIVEDEINDSSQNKKPTGFLKASIANHAQKLFPLNQYLKLVFLNTSKVKVPSVEDGFEMYFIAFPIGKNWWKVNEATEPQLSNKHFFQLQYLPDLLLPYKKTLSVSCVITPLKDKRDYTDQVTELRVSNGDFSGSVKLQINDVEDQIPALISSVSTFFDIPRLFLDFLIHNQKAFEYKRGVNITDFAGWLQQVNQFLWGVIRDSFGFGYRKESDLQSIAERIVKQYSKDSSPNDPELYVKKVIELNEKLYKEIQLIDVQENSSIPVFINIEDWKKLFLDKQLGGGAPDQYEQANIFLIEELKIKEVEKELNDIRIKNKLSPAIRPLVNKLRGLDLTSLTDEEEINSQVTIWLKNWSDFVDLLQSDPVLQCRILFTQWYSCNPILKKVEIDLDTLLNVNNEDQQHLIEYLLWFEKVFINAGELNALQKEGIAMEHEATLAKSLKENINSDLNEISGDCLNALKEYLNYRIDSKNNLYFPRVADPFQKPPSPAYPTWVNFLNFLDHSLNERIEPPSEKIRKAISDEITKTFDEPPHLQIKVDKFESTDSNQEDLNDEVSGHIIIMRRGKLINNDTDFTGNSWRYLNWAKVQLILLPDKFENFLNESLSRSYVVPAFLPEENGNKNALLKISNEKLSLAAGHKAFSDTGYGSNKEGEQQVGYLQYLFDENQKSYALWYGYYYHFAGFVALNSGVLSEFLRVHKDVWNIPKIDFSNADPINIKTYHHLRRVPISKVRIEARKENQQPVEVVPKGLMPLAFELPEWKANVDASSGAGVNLQGEQVHFLLAKGAENFKQETVVLHLKKPTTDFWNWYAWLGPDTNIEVDEEGFTLDQNRERLDDNGQGIKDSAGKPIKGIEPIKSIRQKALEKDIERRDNLNNNKESTVRELCDPAAENMIFVSIDKVFPITEIGFKTFFIKLEKIDSNRTNDYLAEFANQIRVNIHEGETTVEQTSKDRKYNINICAGEILKINIHGLVDTDKLEKFHSWMTAVIGYNNREVHLNQEDRTQKTFIITKPNELWFEAAKPLHKEPLTPDEKKDLVKSIEEENLALWKSLSIGRNGDNVIAQIQKDSESYKDLYKQLAYLSRLEVKHQIWNWNGRLDESGNLLNNVTDEVIRLQKIAQDDKQSKEVREHAINLLIKIDPETFEKLTLENIATFGETTNPMKWEAWAFSDRPDFSALVQETNLSATRHPLLPSNKKISDVMQTIFTDNRPGEEKALYYRFSVTAHCRYELLGKLFKQHRESQIEVDGVFNKWKRYLRKCNKTKPLPKPTIRFAIPLTKSIKECNESHNISSASILVVLEDKWFTEAGLAEQLEVGIDLVNNLGDSGGTYLMAGNDPTLSESGLGKLSDKKDHTNDSSISCEIYEDLVTGKEIRENCKTIFKPKGPVGLTFDFAAQTPRLKGCAFIVDVPNLGNFLEAPNQLEPWSLMQISLRRTLRPSMCEKGVGGNKFLSSEWTAKEWIQFLPSIESFIPIEWRKQVLLKGYVELSFNKETLNILSGNILPVFDPFFERSMERFLIVTKKVFDIGGQPCESYFQTYRYTVDSLGEPNKYLFMIDPKNAPIPSDLPQNKEEGYLRILIVRKPQHEKEEDLAATSIWERLFGKTAEQPVINSVQNDATAALPLVSERIPYIANI